MTYKPIPEKINFFNYKVSRWLLLMLLFCSTQFLFAQSPSGLSINWNTYTGCQQFGEIRGDGGKDPVLIDNIVEGHCVTECNGSEVTYTLSGNLAANPNTTWSATGGTIQSGQTNTTCTVLWSGLGSGSITFTTTTLTGVVTKTICIEKVESPSALFTVAPFALEDEILFGCTQQTTYFTNLSSTNGGSGLYNYFWDFGDQEVNPNNYYSYAFSPTHVYLQDGNYKVKLVVTNSCGCSSTYVKEIKVGKIGFDISCPSVVCDGQTTQYTLPIDGTEVCHDNYKWTVIGGTYTDLNNGSINVTWNNVDATGFGYVSFDPSNCNVNCGLPTTIRVPVIQSVGTITGNASTCLNSQERYVLPQWPATLFDWSIVGGSGGEIIHTDQRNEVIVHPLVSGDLVLRCVYTNTLLHCSGVAEFTIHVNNVLAIEGPSAVCKGTVGNYYIPTGESTSWLLKNSLGNVLTTVANSNTFSYNFTTSGTYTLSVGGIVGCPSSPKIIKVTGISDPSAISGPTEICPGAPYTYSISGSNPNAQYHWQVVGNTGTIVGNDTGNSVVVIFNSTAATHTISVYNQSEDSPFCSSNAVTYTVNKKTIPAEIYPTPNGVTTVCANTYATYDAVNLGLTTPYNDGDTYTWSITNPTLGSITSGQGTKSITVLWNNVLSNTPATLQLVIQKCTVVQTFTKVITIQPKPTIVVTAGATSVCSGVGVNFTVSAAPGYTLNSGTVTWTINGVTSAETGMTLSNATFNNVSGVPNIQYVTATVSNPNGCGSVTNTASAGITVNPEPTATCSIQGVGYNTFCTASQINAVLASSTITGATIQWYKVPGTPLTGQTSPTLNTALFGFNTYYFIATLSGCSSKSNEITISQFCGDPIPCTITQAAPVNKSYNGCSATPPVNTGCTSCNVITLLGTVTGTPVQTKWVVNGPVNFTTYNTLTTTINNATVGIYNTFFTAFYNCSGSTTTLGGKTTAKTITIPYLADFDYNLTCNGSTFTLGVTEKTPFLSGVLNKSFKYCYKAPGSSTFTTPTLVTNGNSTSFATLTTPGTYELKLIVQGNYGGSLKQACEKTISFTIAPVPAQTIVVNNGLAIACHDTPVQFGLSLAPTPGDSYLWTFDNGATNTLQSPKRVFDAPGTYSVGLVITNKYGCTRTVPSVQVVIPPKCFNGTITSSPSPASVCQGGTIALHYTPSGTECGVKPLNGYTWMNGNTVLGTTSANNYIVNSSGFYWVKVASDNNCTYNTSNRITPIIKPLPNVTLNSTSTFCRATDVSLGVTTNASIIVWTIDGVHYPDFDNLKNVVIPADWGLAPGTHPVSVTVTSDQGCSNTVTGSFVIANSPPVPELSMTVISCNPYLVKVSASGSFGNYTWSNGYGYGSDSTVVTHGGPISVNVSSGGCSVGAQIYVPKSMEEYMWIFPTGCFTACADNPGTLIGPSIVPTAAWEWDFDYSGLIGGSGSVQPLVLDQSGVYNLSMTNDLLCTTVSNDLKYSTYECPKCKIEASVQKIEHSNVSFCSVVASLVINNGSGIPLPITISIPSNEAIVSPSSFIAPMGSSSHVVTFTPINGFMGGNVDLVLTGFDSKNNINCDTHVSFVLPSCEAMAKTQLTTNEVSANDLLIAPNPSHGMTNISYVYTSSPELIVYDLLGKEVAHHNATENKGIWQLNTSGIAAGVYVVVMKNEEGILMQKKLIIE